MSCHSSARRPSRKPSSPTARRCAHRFATLARDLVKKHGFIAYQSKLHFAMASVAFWTQPVGSAIDFWHSSGDNNRFSQPSIVAKREVPALIYRSQNWSDLFASRHHKARAPD
jgi:hypothetical protein